MRFYIKPKELFALDGFLKEVIAEREAPIDLLTVAAKVKNAIAALEVVEVST